MNKKQLIVGWGMRALRQREEGYEKIFYVISLLLMVLFLSGCQTYTRYYSSAPSNKDMLGRGQTKRIIFSDMEVSVVPHNSVQTLDLFAITIVPVWFDNKNIKLNKGSFVITLRFFPKEEGFKFIPEEVFLRVGDKEGIRPVKYYGPRPYSQDHADFYKGCSYRWYWPDIICGDLEYDKEVYNTNCHAEADVKFLQLWNCFDLVFDVDTPDASQDISLKIKGLRKNGNLYDIPTINFKKVPYDRSDSVP